MRLSFTADASSRQLFRKPVLLSNQRWSRTREPLLQRPTSAEIRARNFLTDKKILDLFHFLIGHLLVDEPDDPIDYLHDLLDKCLLFRSGLIEPPLLFDKRHVESLFQSLDPTSSGHISLNGYKIGMITLGICDFNHEPTRNKHGRVDKQTFVDEARACLVKMLRGMIEK
ncbi:EF-hand calcium-binding domain-containing protein 10-like [Venturia canescens]|uniref:EF-hand calcium-binding domain-containing protein 10-like n=1 Tax=Venturia canescens TaxID=32260 RepID=UPI001C9CEB27|nr:EF-hand calcium-binding domain-containing protein 10-like [Venturia canescens]